MRFLRKTLGSYLDPNAIETYLLAHGWEDSQRTDMYSTWTRGGDERTEHLFLPLSPVPADYEDRLQEAVYDLALAEGLDPAVMLTNLRYASSDLVRVRLMSPRVESGELPIEDGRNLFEGARDMMLAAACAAVQPRANFGPRAPEAVRDYLDGVRLGQTEEGSYVVTVISDITPAEQQPFLPDEAAHLDIPFERRVTTRLVTALGATHGAAERVLRENTDVGETFEDVVEQGVSANLCAAIAKIGEEQTAANVRVTVDWAVSRPAAVDVVPAVTFEAGQLGVLDDAVQALRELGPFDDEVVEGFVTRLNRGKDEAAIGSIVIQGTAHGAQRNVHVELPDDQYHHAIEAHDARRPVRIRGTLAKKGRNWILSDPGQLRLEGSSGLD